jgi:hypothetical protein
VRAALDDAPVVHHENLLRVHDRRQPVRDHQRGPVPGDLVELLLDRALRRESSAEVASSNSRIGGFFSSVRAIATRCFSPPDSFSPRSPTGVS